MASIRKHKSGYRAEVFRKGIRRSKVFLTRAAAKEWAAREEYLILNARVEAGSKPFRDILDRYAAEVSPGKRGERWEVLRLAKIGRDKIGDIALSDLRQADFADWRDRRLKDVSSGSVRREMILLSGVLSIARKEWGLLSENPMEGVRKPADAPPRDRLPTADEFKRMAHSAGDDLSTMIGRAHHAFLFAVETGMRAGEICGLEWSRVDLARRVASLPETKNGTAREVPLSAEAISLLKALPRMDTVFGLDVRQLESQWRKLRDRAGVVGLTFHDSRHCAVTRLSRKLDVLALARMVGHRDIRMLQSYYNESAEDIARRL